VIFSFKLQDFRRLFTASIANRQPLASKSRAASTASIQQQTQQVQQKPE